MSTSNKSNPPPGGAPSSYTRFIPREELGAFAAWAPETFEPPPKPPAAEESGVRKPSLAERAAAEMRPTMKSQPVRHAAQAGGTAAGVAPAAARPAPQAAGPGTTQGAQAKAAPRRPIVGGVPGEEAPEPPPATAPLEPAVDVEALTNEARQAGYQDGYRNGLAALESYKQTQAAQMAAYMSGQVGALVADLHQRLEALEQQLAGRIAGVALELARQVVRTELLQRPEVVVEVAEQALGALLTSARHVVLRLHPDDHALAQAQLAELLQARGARVVPDAAITRGGCFVESDIAVVDATVEARWERASAAMGHDAPWNGGREALEPTDNHIPETEEVALAPEDVPHAPGHDAAHPHEHGDEA